MKTVLKVLALVAAMLGMDAPLRAAITVSVDMDPATPGIQSSRSIAAGQVIAVDLVMSVDAGGVSSYSISAQFDKAELALNGSPAASVPALPGGLATFVVPSESNSLGRVYSVNAGTLSNGPVSTSFVIGSVSFTASAPATDASADITLGVFNTGVDGCFDNAGQSVAPTFESGKLDLQSADTMTQAPTLTAPATGTVTKAPVTVTFTLPETAKAGSVQLIFTSEATGALTLTLAASQESAADHTVAFHPGDPTGSSSGAIASGVSIPDGVYTVAISYQDAAGNAAATATSTNVTIDTTTQTPTITSPTNGARVLQTFDVTFTLPEAAKPGSVKLTLYDINTLTDFPLTGAANETAGSHTVTLDATALGTSGFNLTLTYQDTADHAAATTAPIFVELRPTAPVSAKFLAAGGTTADLAPGAGTFPGLPADAKLASFGVPAIDDLGSVAFVAKWTSASTRTKGIGLFTNDRCVAVVGGDASAVGGTGATWKSFTDPVVTASRVVCIATMAGVRTGATAVVGNLDDLSALEKIARVGDPAPGASIGGATFKAFKAVTAEHKAGIVRVAFLAQLTNGTGTPKVTAANDTGLWSYELGTSLFVMRESEVVAGRTIKTLVAFKPGNGSPGCGRGTLFAASTARGTPIVSALALFTDRTQGIIAQDIDDGPPSVKVTFSGDAATGVDNGATFASYGLPARDAAETTAFLGKLTLGAGVTKADASGIFTGPDVNGKFATVIRTGLNATQAGTGAKFSLLKDPVLQEFGGLAFPATVKGGTAKGAAMQTLWWKAPNQPLALVAQGGADAAELPGFKWKAFPSLAIAERGPIFAATLTPKATGVWATDFTGTTRLLFRTGGEVGGKTVKSFKVLAATVGTTGVTRSFNDNGQVAWLATFTDKTTAIVVTEVP